MAASRLAIDAFDQPPLRATNGADWALIADRVMGGRSAGALSWGEIDGRRSLRMTGAVSLENDGGFLQVALFLSPDGGVLDASGWTGVEIDVTGNGEDYGLHLRTTDIRRPWQSYRQSFRAGPAWRTERLPFAAFTPHRIETPLALTRLRRLGVVAIGRAFAVDVAVAGIRLYR